MAVSRCVPRFFKSPLTKFLTSLRGLELEGGGFKAKVDAAEAEQQQAAKNPFVPESGELFQRIGRRPPIVG